MCYLWIRYAPDAKSPARRDRLLDSSNAKRRKYQAPEILPRLGRPWRVFDLDMVYELASIGCTHEEIAKVLKTSADTISRRLRDDPQFIEAHSAGWADLRMSLRVAQIKKAKSGNVIMLIWLGKNLLNQKDKPDEAPLGPVRRFVPRDDGNGFDLVTDHVSMLEESDG